MLSIMVPMATKAMDVVSCSLLDVVVSTGSCSEKMSSIYEMIERKRGREEGGVDGRSSKQDLDRFHTSCKPTSSLHVPYDFRHTHCNLLSPLFLWDNAPGRTLLSSPLSHITTKPPSPSIQTPKPTNPPSSTVRRWASPVPKISNPYSKPEHKSSPRIQLFPP